MDTLQDCHSLEVAPYCEVEGETGYETLSNASVLQQKVIDAIQIRDLDGLRDLPQRNYMYTSPARPAYISQVRTTYRPETNVWHDEGCDG